MVDDAVLFHADWLRNRLGRCTVVMLLGSVGARASLSMNWYGRVQFNYASGNG